MTCRARRQNWGVVAGWESGRVERTPLIGCSRPRGPDFTGKGDAGSVLIGLWMSRGGLTIKRFYFPFIKY